MTVLAIAQILRLVVKIGAETAQPRISKSGWHESVQPRITPRQKVTVTEHSLRNTDRGSENQRGKK